MKNHNKVKIFRIESELTQKELASNVGVTRQTMSLIEKGEYNPTINLCLRICYQLNKTLDEIFWIDEGEIQHETSK
ncbi:MAG: helix-turn-helix transcriptional regulator [Liquorilactobacillus mali]|uniref:helix-turn-helix transcriptional regulator n=1 Tax=Liquorilactobacillus mali TaxID=1618 RepID=UPI0039E84811